MQPADDGEEDERRNLDDGEGDERRNLDSPYTRNLRGRGMR